MNKSKFYYKFLNSFNNTFLNNRSTFMSVPKKTNVRLILPFHNGHLNVLDGWRGVSILMVLAAHLLPLGPKLWQLNESVGILGMVLFFILSGFLITSFLLKNQSIFSFLLRRFFRVIPLAWLYLAISLSLSHASDTAWAAHFLFYANLPPKDLLPLTDHMWSLCLEVQFYVGVAILVAVFRKGGLYLLPILCLFFTGVRIWEGVYASSVSYYRIDEILAGCTLALIYSRHSSLPFKFRFGGGLQWLLVVLLCLSCSTYSEWLNYFRPYIAAILIGSTILNPNTSLVNFLNHKAFLYLAGISFSLYVLHPLLAASWLGSGEVIIKYAKRPLLFAMLLVLSIISTKYFEKSFIYLGRKLSDKFNAPVLRRRE